MINAEKCCINTFMQALQMHEFQNKSLNNRGGCFPPNHYNKWISHELFSDCINSSLIVILWLALSLKVQTGVRPTRTLQVWPAEPVFWVWAGGKGWSTTNNFRGFQSGAAAEVLEAVFAPVIGYHSCGAIKRDALDVSFSLQRSGQWGGKISNWTLSSERKWKKGHILIWIKLDYNTHKL